MLAEKRASVLCECRMLGCYACSARVSVYLCMGIGACVLSLRAVRPSAELQPSSGGGWMPSVTPEASVWAQLGFL